MRHLITLEDISRLARACNADRSIAASLIAEAERQDIKPKIGDALFIAITQDDTPAGYDTLLDGGEWAQSDGTARWLTGLRTAAAYYAYARIIRDGNIQSTRYGAVVKTEDNSADAERSERMRQYREAFAAADGYMTEVLDYLRQNACMFPEYQTKTFKANRTIIRTLDGCQQRRKSRYSDNTPTVIAGQQGPKGDPGDPGIETYDIGWLLNLIATSGSGIVTLTAEQFNEVKAAVDAGKIFVAYRNVYSSGISIDGGNTSIVLATLSGGGTVTTLFVISRNGTYNASLRAEQIATQNDLSGFAKASDVPKKTSQLTNDSGFLTEHQSLDGYARKREVVKTIPSTIGYGTSEVADTPSIELAADKFHIIGRCTGLTLTLPAGADMDGQEYCCQFYVANSQYTLTVPADVRWQNGEVPTFEGNTCCQLVIVNNCATIGVFKASS
nr:MAG TPA: PROTEIN (MANNOSE-BINDING PROTEIN A), HOST DEFENSE, METALLOPROTEIN, SUGAR.9A [Caudoviricetes sp.]